MKTAIVIGGTHFNTIGAIRSLGEAGYDVVLFIEPCNIERYLWRFSKYVKEYAQLQSFEEIVPLLLNKYATTSAKIPIVCTSDFSICILDKNYSLLAEKFRIFNIGQSDGMINHFMDKKNVQEVAIRCGLKVIPTWNVAGIADITDEIPYPCFVKGDNSIKVSKDAICICHNREELEGVVREGEGYLVQEYIQKDCEVNLGGLALDGGKRIIMPGVVVKERESLRRMGEYMRLDALDRHPDLNLGALRRCISEIGYEGSFSIEFLKRGNEYYFLEVNFRNDGLNYIYTKSGANMLALWAKSANYEILEDEVRKLKCRTPFHMMWWLADIQNVREGKISLIHWLKDFLLCDGDYMLSWRDPEPVLYFAWRGARKLFIGLFGRIKFWN